MKPTDSQELSQRCPEPELMDDPQQADAYAQADFAEANTMFMDTFCTRFPDFRAGRVVDLGCGPGDIALRFARRFPDTHVLGVDGAPVMLDWAQRSIQAAGLQDRVAVLDWRLGSTRTLPEPLSKPFAAILSNSLLHHLHDPLQLWRTVKTCAQPGAAILIMDLIRPATRADARALVQQYSANEPEVLRRDFFNSLLAAFREDEVHAQLQASGLSELQVARVSDRHLAVGGRLSGP